MGLVRRLEETIQDTQLMVAPTLVQIAYVALGFGVVGIYILVVHRIIKSAEKHN